MNKVMKKFLVLLTCILTGVCTLISVSLMGGCFGDDPQSESSSLGGVEDSSPQGPQGLLCRRGQMGSPSAALRDR